MQSKGSSPTVGALRDSTTEAMTPTAAIGQQELSEAMEALQKYKGGKANYESRIKSNEKWWRLRHWDELRSKQPHAGESPEPASAWLFNSILNKHADAMDNYPEPVCLPREPSDEESAKTLSAILPVIMEDIGRSFTLTAPLTFRTIPIGGARTSTRTPRTSMTTRSARSRASALWRPRKRRFSTPRI